MAAPEPWPFPGARRERDPAGLGAAGASPGRGKAAAGAQGQPRRVGMPLRGLLLPEWERWSPDSWRLGIQDKPGGAGEAALETWLKARAAGHHPRSQRPGSCTEAVPPVALLVGSRKAVDVVSGRRGLALRGLLVHV